MKRTTTRIAVASAMTAAIALGTVSAAEAHGSKPSHSREHAHENRDAKKLAHAKSHIARDVAHKVTGLSKAEKRVVRAELGAENTDAIKANIAADKAALVALGQDAAAATTLADAYKAAKAVGTYRPEVYDQVRYVLRTDNYLAVKANGINAAITTVSADADAKAAAGADVTVARAALADATALTFKAVASMGASEDKALTVHANTPKRGSDSALKAAKTEAQKAIVSLGQASAKVEAAKAALAAPAAPATAAARR